VRNPERERESEAATVSSMEREKEGYAPRGDDREGYDRRDRDRDGGRDRDRDRDRDRGRERYSRDRDRDRDHYSRRYSRRRSRSRSRSESPGREERRRERRRRATGFDQGPGMGGPPPPYGGMPPGGPPPPYGMPPPSGRPSAIGPNGQPTGLSAANPYPGARGNGGPGNFASAVQQMQPTRHARRIYVGNLPTNISEPMLSGFFAQALQAVGGTTQVGNPILSVYLNMEKKFSFVEFRNVEETSNAMALDGILFEGSNLRVRRPNDYNAAVAATLGPSNPDPKLNLGVVGLRAGGYKRAADDPDRLFMGGLPYYLTEVQIRELLSQFGAVSAFDLVKDKETGNSKGYGFAVFEDSSVVDGAIQGLNGLRMGDRALTVRRAAEGPQRGQQQQQQQQVNSFMQAAGAAALQQQTIAALQSQANPTNIIKLSNCVSIAELMDDEEYVEIVEDMRDESARHGEVLEIVIPRPSKTETVQGIGKVFVRYAQVEEAMRAFNAMNGRKFAGNIVVAEYEAGMPGAAGPGAGAGGPPPPPPQ